MSGGDFESKFASMAKIGGFFYFATICVLYVRLSVYPSVRLNPMSFLLTPNYDIAGPPFWSVTLA